MRTSNKYHHLSLPCGRPFRVCNPLNGITTTTTFLRLTTTTTLSRRQALPLEMYRDRPARRDDHVEHVAVLQPARRPAIDPRYLVADFDLAAKLRRAELAVRLSKRDNLDAIAIGRVGEAHA